MSRSNHPPTSATTEAQVLGAVDDHPRGHKEVHARVGMWADRTVMGVLNDLVRRGVVERSVVPVGRFGKSVYRLRRKP
jgi:DNA-binding HxlR family transcriptional regulator